MEVMDILVSDVVSVRTVSGWVRSRPPIMDATLARINGQATSQIQTADFESSI
jgi:hypothetical protein